ncbi:hypothetical protein JTB14_018152 [Gonioctena quinquepunctata]|nr:hypothetical protein JTB14_018152 [Gonioctena quinquepunctata]
MADYSCGPDLHGGSAIYPAPNFKSEEMVCECSSVVFKIDNFKCVIISLYRSQSSDADVFLEKCYNMLNLLDEMTLTYFVAGDIDTLSNGRLSRDL